VFAFVGPFVSFYAKEMYPKLQRAARISMYGSPSY
jgi:hypothetical protein